MVGVVRRVASCSDGMCGGCPRCGFYDDEPAPMSERARMAALRASDEGADIAMQRRADEDAEPAEFLDGCLPCNR